MVTHVAGIALCCLVAACRPARSAEQLDLPTLRKLRKEAAHRPRRMIFNNDGDDVIYTKKEPTAEALLDCVLAINYGGS